MRSRTASVANRGLVVLSAVGVCVVALAINGAPDAAYEALGSVALAVGLGTSVGSAAVGARHYGAKESSSAKGEA